MRNFWLSAEQKASISTKMSLSPWFAPKITRRDATAEIKALCVPPFSPLLPMSPHTATLWRGEREKKKEFLPRFSRRVDLGHTLLFTCRSLAVRLSRILVPILLLSACVLILVKCCDRHPACSFFVLLTPAPVHHLFVIRLKGAFGPVHRLHTCTSPIDCLCNGLDRELSFSTFKNIVVVILQFIVCIGYSWLFF